MPKKKPQNERWAAFLAGELSVSDMDDEEIERGRFRSRDGSFKGVPPATVPRDFGQQLSRELLRRTDSRFKAGLFKVQAHLYHLIFNADRDDVQLKATLAWLERVVGKVPDKVEMSAGEPSWWSEVDRFLDGMTDEQKAMAQVILRRNQRVIEGTSHSADDEDDWADTADADVDADADIGAGEERMVRLFLEEEAVRRYGLSSLSFGS